MTAHARPNGDTGVRIARLFRKARILDGIRAVDVDAIAASDEIVIVESEVRDPGYVACLMRVPGAAGILVAAGQERGRRRFSIAHELGHYHIPTHSGLATLQCGDAELRARPRNGGPNHEAEANQFAAELLMPFRLFGDDARRHDLSLAAAARLAASDMYDVSVMAAAWRMLETTREAGQLIVSAEGRVLWSVASKSWRWDRGWKGDILADGSVARAVLAGESSSGKAEEVDATCWLESGRSHPAHLLESSLAVPVAGQVMTLLWAPDPD